MSTATELRREMGQMIFSAMTKADVDWSRESELATSALAELDEAWARYSENKASKAEVREAYKKFRDAHKGGLF